MKTATRHASSLVSLIWPNDPFVHDTEHVNSGCFMDRWHQRFGKDARRALAMARRAYLSDDNF